MKPLISVVIPVYNTARYIKACVESVLQQDYPAVEILLVDDGSTDGSAAVCDRFQEKYPDRVAVIHKKNEGLGMARNTGFSHAKGEYVAFVDSDDMLDSKKSLSVLEARAEAVGADIVTGCYRRFDGDDVSGVNHHCLREGSYTESRDFRIQGFLLHGHLAYVWGKLYRRSFLTEHHIWSGNYPLRQTPILAPLVKVPAASFRITFLTYGFLW